MMWLDILWKTTNNNIICNLNFSLRVNTCMSAKKIFNNISSVPYIVIFLDFHSTKQGLPMVDFGHMVLTKIKCIPIVIHLSKKYCTPLGIHYSMWSKHGGAGWNWQCFSHLLYTYRRWEKHCQFPFSWMNTTTQTWSLKLKTNDFQRYPRANKCR